MLVSSEAKTGPGTRIPYSTAAAAVVALRLNEMDGLICGKLD